MKVETGIYGESETVTWGRETRDKQIFVYVWKMSKWNSFYKIIYIPNKTQLSLNSTKVPILPTLLSPQTLFFPLILSWATSLCFSPFLSLRQQQMHSCLSQRTHKYPFNYGSLNFFPLLLITLLRNVDFTSSHCNNFNFIPGQFPPPFHYCHQQCFWHHSSLSESLIRLLKSS